MSFRDLRNFTEIMRALGYPRSVSMDNFRAPNFQLVADVLYWMVKRYDPDIAVSDNIESENDRVDFLTGVAEAMLNKAHIKLSAKRLYAADGHAVKELLKLATLLYSASRVEQNDTGGGGGGGGGAASSTFADDEAEAPLTSQLGNIKEVRALATEIMTRGARLHDLLGKEAEARPQRLKAVGFLETVSGSLGSTRESELIESGGREILARSRDNIAAMRRQCEDLEADEAELNAKIKKKRNELDRGEKRLKSLQAHRPAFADELDKLEGELRRYYEVYVDRFRNLDFLEHNLDRFHESEMEELEEYERKRNRNAERVRREQLKQVRQRGCADWDRCGFFSCCWSLRCVEVCCCCCCCCRCQLRSHFAGTAVLAVHVFPRRSNGQYCFGHRQVDVLSLSLYHPAPPALVLLNRVPTV
ncbi:unnamed protein product, partial [Ectocarpus sp. 6 AP-2014]